MTHESARLHKLLRSYEDAISTARSAEIGSDAQKDAVQRMSAIWRKIEKEKPSWLR